MSCVERVTPSSDISVTKCHDRLWRRHHDPDEEFLFAIFFINSNLYLPQWAVHFFQFPFILSKDASRACKVNYNKPVKYRCLVQKWRKIWMGNWDYALILRRYGHLAGFNDRVLDSGNYNRVKYLIRRLSDRPAPASRRASSKPTGCKFQVWGEKFTKFQFQRKLHLFVPECS